MNEYSDTTPDNEDSSKRSFESFSDAIEAGKSDAAANADEKFPDLKAGLANAMHDLAYGIGYGSVFAGSFLNELLPSNVREGFAKGADAGKAAGKTASENVQNALDPNAQSDDSPDPSFS